MEDVRQIAIGGYKQVQENGPDVCDSESDSENSDHGENIPVESMYTAELIGEDAKRKHGGPPKRSANQAFVLREAAHQMRESARPTMQAEPQPLAQSGPTIQAQSRPNSRGRWPR
jgi:hypothetical protein